MATKLQNEQSGLIAVHGVCNAMNAIWRPTQTTDLGIDGQIEFLDRGGIISTGKLIAVQVKSGPSYFAKQNQRFVPFSPKPRHRRYWQNLKLPVFLVLHDPTRNLTLYEFVRPHLEAAGPIRVSTTNILSAASRDMLIEIHDSVFFSRIQRISEPTLESFRDLELQQGSGSHFKDNAHNLAPMNGIHFLLSAMNPEDGYPGGPYFELRGQRIDAALVAAGGAPLREYHHWFEFTVRCLEKCWAYGMIESFAAAFDTWHQQQSALLDRTVELTAEGRAISQLLLGRSREFLKVPPQLKARFKSPKALARHIIRSAEQASETLDRSERIGDYIL